MTAIESPEIHNPLELYPAHIKERLDYLDDSIRRAQQMRRWILDNEGKLANLVWDHLFWSNAIQIECDVPKYTRNYETKERNPRNIARRFPGRVFIRRKTDNECGSIDWVSSPVGTEPEIRIEHAEKMEWKPIAKVDLTDDTSPTPTAAETEQQ